MNYEKIVKLLNMTTSSNDGEALNAIRFANTILLKARKTWNDVLGSVIAEEPRRTRPQEPTDIEMLRFLMICPLGPNTRRFIDGLWRFYKKRGYLTTTQVTSIREIYQSYSYR